ncbi:type II toxin-antitoxin system RelE/ParE family toxin [Pantoea sp. BAV 3049]|uniref:type II toxin-antitoxin system RelE/ParE family toxin n=1 Tax=Pantoea sp. BAV 3049 TaxID=2654188 RepID=UPI00131C75D9|nr:type II toxin-antitoxin system RelE/ParE family toxin [Pantoea sp. BAV 3049]
MARFTLTQDAQENMCEIKGYSIREFGQGVAKEYLSAMRTTFQRLADNPETGHDETASFWPDVFSFPCVIHTVYYILNPGGITVIGVIHQSRLPGLLPSR